MFIWIDKGKYITAKNQKVNTVFLYLDYLRRSQELGWGGAKKLLH